MEAVVVKRQIARRQHPEGGRSHGIGTSRIPGDRVNLSSKPSTRLARINPMTRTATGPRACRRLPQRLRPDAGNLESEHPSITSSRNRRRSASNAGLVTASAQRVVGPCHLRRRRAALPRTAACRRRRVFELNGGSTVKTQVPLPTSPDDEKRPTARFAAARVSHRCRNGATSRRVKGEPSIWSRATSAARRTPGCLLVIDCNSGLGSLS